MNDLKGVANNDGYRGFAAAAADDETRAETSAAGAVRSREEVLKVDDERSRLRDEMTPEQAEMLASIIGQAFGALQNIVENMKPSEQELEVLRRRIEELRQLQHDLKDRKVDYELARKTLANILADEVVKKFLPPLEWTPTNFV